MLKLVKYMSGEREPGEALNGEAKGEAKVAFAVGFVPEEIRGQTTILVAFLIPCVIS
jgi:hypothetical protein